MKENEKMGIFLDNETQSIANRQTSSRLRLNLQYGCQNLNPNPNVGAFEYLHSDPNPH